MCTFYYMLSGSKETKANFKIAVEAKVSLCDSRLLEEGSHYQVNLDYLIDAWHGDGVPACHDQNVIRNMLNDH